MAVCYHFDRLFLISARVLDRILLPVAIACSLLAILGCGRKNRVPADITEQIQGLAQETVRPGGTLESAVSIMQESGSITAEWQVKDRKWQRIL